jgi:hypothetical protein
MNAENSSMKSAQLLIFPLFATALLAGTSLAQNWQTRPMQIQTRWAASVSRTNPLPEYPRPQLVRPHWKNLNGLWQYAVRPKDSAAPIKYDGHILVPYPLESTLSGVQKRLQPDQLLWYRRTVSLEPTNQQRTLLHFGAVDYQATVYLNRHEVGTHAGGYESFAFDITDELESGPNELLVKVWDPTETGPNPHGKQTLRPHGIFYTSNSGIWQTVWLETVPQTYIESLTMTPDVDHSQLQLRVNLMGKEEGYTVDVTAKAGAVVVARQTVKGLTAVPIRHPHLWSPDEPFLYHLEVRLLRNGKVVDDVKSYFGLRKVEVKKDAEGVDRIFLNDRYTYNLGVLDQGFWPEGIYTAPTDSALEFDIRAIKAMGFNTIRKHIKIEPERWYYHCDRLGILVWQDMVPPSDATAEAQAEFEKEIEETLEQLDNHPSITTWVLFNEGWGAYDQERLARLMKTLDPSRLLDGHSGPNTLYLGEWMKHMDPSAMATVIKGDWSPLLRELRNREHDDPLYWAGSDLADIHVYPDPDIPLDEADKARVVGEYGGTGVVILGHTWNDLAGFGYADVTPNQLTKTYASMVDKLRTLESRGLSGSIYTQLVDVEGEQNGLMTYDRAVIKMSVSEISKLNARIVQRARDYASTTKHFPAADPDLTPEAERYTPLLAEYQKGKRDPPFLRYLALMAIREKDQAHATEVGNEFIARTPRPFSKDTWTFITAVTRTAKDDGFALLRTHTRQADAILGNTEAERKVREVIGHEEIEPYLADRSQTPDWAAIETTVRTKYGALGIEELYGAEMVYYLERQDWSKFGTSYKLYFHTAASRSEYPVNLLSYVVFEHVADPSILEAGVDAIRCSMEASPSERNDAAEVDTLANLLYKGGRIREALELEEEATQISEGRDQEIINSLTKMKSRQPTWPDN